MSGAVKVLVVEPWFGGSHRSAIEGLSTYSRHEIRPISLPARHWKWRMQGGAVALAEKAREAVETGFQPDVILASSLLNVPVFLTLARGVLGDIPVLLYMHENQLTYPVPEDETRDYTYGFINYQSCLAADRVAFNSRFHRESFMEALRRLLARLPDSTRADTVDAIEMKSIDLPLGIDTQALDGAGDRSDRSDASTPAILWNHRWEYDKNPRAFFDALGRLDDEGLHFDLILLGENFESRPDVFDVARSRFGDRILQFGFVPDFAGYARWLHRADIVVSTSVHEFFGLAVLEAMHCGCHPLLPRRLSYPEIVSSLEAPGRGTAPVLYDRDEDLVSAMRSLLRRDTDPVASARLRELTAGYDWKVRAADFDDVLNELKLTA